MKIIQKQIVTSGRDYFRLHLNIINPLLPNPMSQKEVEIVAAFMSLPENVTGTEPFNTYARKIVKKDLHLSSGGLSNYLGPLIEKKILHKEELSGRISISPYLYPEKNRQGYQFKIINKNEAGE